MRGLLKSRRRPQAPTVPEAAAPAACALLRCPQCGLELETLALRCPRCRADIPFGCGGDCRSCGKASR